MFDSFLLKKNKKKNNKKSTTIATTVALQQSKLFSRSLGTMQRDMMPSYIQLQKSLAIVPKPGAFLSFVASTFVVYSIINSPCRRNKVYHRLVLVMMILNGTSSGLSSLCTFTESQFLLDGWKL